MRNCFRKCLVVLMFVCMFFYGKSSYALHEYTIDFKAGVFHGLSVNVEEREIKDGILRLNLNSKDKNVKLSVTKPVHGGLGSNFPRGIYALNSRQYEEIRLMARVKAIGLENDKQYIIRLSIKTDKGDIDVSVPIKDVSGTKFNEYQFKLKDIPAWKDASTVKEISFLISPEKQNFTTLTVDVEYIKFIPLRKIVVDHKLAQVDETKILYLDKCVPAFLRNGIEIKDLAQKIKKFKEIIEQAKEYHQKNDIENAYEEIEKAEKLHNVFYAWINTGWELVEIKERIEGAEDIIKLYKSKTRRRRNLPSIRKIKKEYTACKEALKNGNYSIKKALESIKTRIDVAYSALDKASPYALPIRLGLSQSSYGRFGWMPADFGEEGLLIYNLMRSPNSISKGFNNHTRIVLSSDTYKRYVNPIISEKKEDVSWVSYRRNILFRASEGKGQNIHWDYICSLLAPGIILKTDSKDLILAQKRRKKLAPTHIVIYSDNKSKIIELTKEKIAPDMQENWMLLLWQGKEKYNPLLLVFEKKPDGLQIGKRGKNLSIFRASGLGHIGIVDFEGVIPFDYKKIDKWLKNIPDNVGAKCRMLAGIMMNYPYKCKEFYGIDEKNRQILIRNEIEYYSINDEWNTPHYEYAPIPPMIAYFMDIGYPTTTKQKQIDFNVSTKYGPYRAVSGNVLEYKIPIPDFNHRSYLKTKGTELDKKKRAHIQGINQVKQSYWYRIGLNIRNALSWNILDNKNRKLVLDKTKLRLYYYKKMRYSSQNGITSGNPGKPEQGKAPYFCGPAGHTTTVDRIEPYTGKYHCSTGWNEVRKGRLSSTRVYGDNINGFGHMLLQPYYYYAKYSGDWQFILDNWLYIKRIFLIAGRVNDWANLAIDYAEEKAHNYVDMGPDVLKFPVSFMKLARAVGDKEAYLHAAYIASKQAINRMSFFTLGDYMQKYSDIAQSGDYCLDLGVGEFGCAIGDYANMSWKQIADSFKGKDRRLFYSLFQNIWTGCGPIFIEDYDVWSQYFPEQAGKIAFEKIPEHIPDFYCEYQGKTAARYMIARTFLGESTEDLWSYFNLFDYWNISNVKTDYIFTALQGRDAPAYLIDWEPNKLLQGDYDFEKELASIKIDASTKSVVKLKSWVKPDWIKNNGKLLGNRFWQYDSRRKELTIQIDKPGKHSLDIKYVNWQKPVRKSYSNIAVQRSKKTKKKIPAYPGDLGKGLTFYANFDNNEKAVFAKGDEYINRRLILGGPHLYGNISYSDGLKGEGLCSTLKQNSPRSIAVCSAEENVPAEEGTISFWIKPNFSTQDMKNIRKEVEKIMIKRGLPLSHWHYFKLQLLEVLPPLSMKAHDNILLYVIGEKCSFSHHLLPYCRDGSIMAWTRNNGSSSSTLFGIGGIPFEKEKWTHFVTTWAMKDNNICFKVYKNGALHDTTNTTLNNNVKSVKMPEDTPIFSTLELMKHYYYPVLPQSLGEMLDLKCTMDELRMYNRALSAEEVKQLNILDKADLKDE